MMVGRRQPVALVMARQEHDGETSDAAMAYGRRRLAPRAFDRLLARAFQPLQVVNAGAADDAKHCLRHEISFAWFVPLLSMLAKRDNGITTSIVGGECGSNKNAPSRPGVRPSPCAGTTGRCVCDLNLQLDHVEVALGGAAHRTDPVVRNVGPSCARREALIGVALFLVIDVAAGPALPGFIGFVGHRDRLSSGGFRHGEKLSYLLDG